MHTPLNLYITKCFLIHPNKNEQVNLHLCFYHQSTPRYI